MKIRALSILSLLLIYTNCISAYVSENSLKAWQDNKLSMMIRFRMPDNNKEKAQKEYFSLEKFNADSIVSFAISTGIRTIIAPAKIDNMYLFDTSTDDNRFSNRDIIEELSKACGKKEVRFGIYLPITDDNKNYSVSKKTDKDTHKQITELLTKYGKISEISFDMNPKSPEESKGIYELVHKLQPDCMVSNDAGNGHYDFCNLLKYHSPKGLLECNWRYDSSLSQSPSGDAKAIAKKTVQKIADAASFGGGYMFNVHIENGGRINPNDKEMMRYLGIWLKENGHAIYETTHSPFNEGFEWGTVTKKDNILYFILSGKYPKDGRIKLYMPEYELMKADGKLATCIQKNGLIDIAIPASAYKGDKINVLTLKFKQIIEDKQPEQIRSITLKRDNAQPLYSISGFDFSSTYKSIVKYSWDFEQLMLKQLELIYTGQEKGKTLEIELDCKTYNVKLDKGKPSQLTASSPVTWGKQYICGPDKKLFHDGLTIATDIDNPPVENSKWKETAIGKQTFAAKDNETYYVLQNIESPKEQNIIVDAGAGNGIEIYLNGKSIMKHLNPYGCDFRMEKVLLHLNKGNNQIVMRIYNRFEKNISYILSPSKDQTIYKQDLTLPDTDKRKIHKLTVRQAGLPSQNDDTELSNLRIRPRRIAL